MAYLWLKKKTKKNTTKLLKTQNSNIKHWNTCECYILLRKMNESKSDNDFPPLWFQVRVEGGQSLSQQVRVQGRIHIGQPLPSQGRSHLLSLRLGSIRQATSAHIHSSGVWEETRVHRENLHRPEKNVHTPHRQWHRPGICIFSRQH